MTDMHTTKLGVSHSPNFDAVQAMPLDSQKLRTFTLTIDQDFVVVELAADTGLVQLNVLPTQSFTANAYVHSYEVEPANGVRGVYLPPGNSTFTVARSDTPRKLTLHTDYGAIRPGSEMIVQVLEA